MNNLKQYAFLGCAAILMGFSTTSCDRDGDGDNDFGDKCFECVKDNVGITFCEDNYNDIENDFGITNSSDFNDFIDKVNAIDDVNCIRKLF